MVECLRLVGLLEWEVSGGPWEVAVVGCRMLAPLRHADRCCRCLFRGRPELTGAGSKWRF